MKAKNKFIVNRPFGVWLLTFFVFVLATAAIISGPMLFLSPDGSYLQMPTDVLENSPFPDYLIPGIILFICVGLFPLVVGIGLAKKQWQGLAFLNPFKNYHWAWTGSLVVSIILLIWIITETALIGYSSALQPIMAAWAVVIMVLTLLPVVKRYYAKAA
jgi:hypothetical protein